MNRMIGLVLAVGMLALALPRVAAAECIVDTDCTIPLYDPRGFDGFSEDATLDLTKLEFYVAHTLETFAVATEDSDGCPPETDEVCLFNKGEGGYDVIVSSSLNDTADTWLCVKVKDAQGTPSIMNDKLCQRVYAEDRWVAADERGTDSAALEDGGRLQTIDALLASLCQADGRHFTISGTPTDTEFDTDYVAPDDFGLSASPGLSAYVWIKYANGDVDAGRLSAFANTNGHMTLATALSSGAPASGDDGCLSIGVNP